MSPLVLLCEDGSLGYREPISNTSALQIAWRIHDYSFFYHILAEPIKQTGVRRNVEISIFLVTNNRGEGEALLKFNFPMSYFWRLIFS